MAGGRPAKPTAIKKLQGNPGKRPLNKHEPKPAKPAAVPRCPAWLPDDAKKIWREHAKKLWAAGVLTELDVSAAAALVEAEALYRLAVDMIRVEGSIQVTKSGYQQLSGWMTVRNNALKQAQALWREFGMTPSARSRIEVKPEEEEDEFAKLFGGSETVARKARKAG